MISISTYQIGYDSLNVSFNLTNIKVLKTSDDVYICAHGVVAYEAF